MRNCALRFTRLVSHGHLHIFFEFNPRLKFEKLVEVDSGRPAQRKDFVIVHVANSVAECHALITTEMLFKNSFDLLEPLVGHYRSPKFALLGLKNNKQELQNRKVYSQTAKMSIVAVLGQIQHKTPDKLVKYRTNFR